MPKTPNIQFPEKIRSYEPTFAAADVMNPATSSGFRAMTYIQLP
jgi:hypothetical protein